MMVIGCGSYPSWQQICCVGTVTGEKKLEHVQREAENYNRGLPGAALIGMESTGNCQWFTELVAS